MGKAFAAAAILWPMVLGGSTIARIQHRVPWFESTVYLAAGLVCHQRPDRSFHTAEVQWPVCARCSGLYLAAPLGAIAALAVSGQFRRSRDLTVLACAAIPTVVTFAAEHVAGAHVSSSMRFVAALPLGAAVAWVIVRAVREPAASIE